MFTSGFLLYYNMKKYTIDEFRNYLLKQDSLGDIHYFLNEDNVDKANELEDEEYDLDDPIGW